jgi:hypothetical protein
MDTHRAAGRETALVYFARLEKRGGVVVVGRVLVALDVEDLLSGEPRARFLRKRDCFGPRRTRQKANRKKQEEELFHGGVVLFCWCEGVVWCYLLLCFVQGGEKIGKRGNALFFKPFFG